MSNRKKYNKEEHLHFIDTLLETEQVDVFINNIIDDMENKEMASDTLEYLYNQIMQLHQNLYEAAGRCKYLLANNEVVINGERYYKHSCDDIITKYILDSLERGKE